jgi:hypothetical protein
VHRSHVTGLRRRHCVDEGRQALFQQEEDRGAMIGGTHERLAV